MKLKISLCGVLFCIFNISIMFSGILFEGISILCLAIVALIERKHIVRYIGIKIYLLSFITIAVFFFMCYMQFKVGNVNLSGIIRLIGLTKGICAPAIFLISYSTTCMKKESLNLLVVLMVGLNILYIVQTVMNIEWLADYFVLGSVNGCSGVNVVLLAVVIPQIQNGYRLLGFREMIYIITAYTNVLLCGSDTALALIVLETVAFGVMSPRMRSVLSIRRKKRLFSVLICIGIISAFLFVGCIANGTIKMSSDSLGTRVAIWRQAIRQFGLQTYSRRLFGTGGDYVQMMSQRLEAHNFVIEILLIYGFVGVTFFFIMYISILKYLVKRMNVNSYDLLFPVSLYIAICLMHPFFTGVFTFQWFCVSAILCVLMAEMRCKLPLNEMLTK